MYESVSMSTYSLQVYKNGIGGAVHIFLTHGLSLTVSLRCICVSTYKVFFTFQNLIHSLAKVAKVLFGSFQNGINISVAYSIVN